MSGMVAERRRTVIAEPERATLSQRNLSLIASGVPVLSALGVTPMLTRGLGPESFGLWVTIMTVLALVQVADLGISSSALRFMVLAQREHGRRAVGRLFGTLSTVYVALGALVAVAAATFSGWVSRVLGDDVLLAVVLLTALVVLVPVSNVGISALQSLGEFRGIALLVAFTQVAYVAAVYGFFATGTLTLTTLLCAQAAQYAAVAAYAALRTGAVREWRVPRQTQVVHYLAFSRGVFLTNLAGVPALYLTVIVANQVLDPTALGVLALAVTASGALRNLPLMTVPPIIRTLTGAPEVLMQRAQAADLGWRRHLVVYGLLCLPAIVVGVPVLGGSAYDDAILPGLLLTTGFLIQLCGAICTITARQLGFTAVEWKASAAGAVVHLVLIVPSLLWFGAVGAGITLIVSQVVTLVPVRAQFVSLLRRPRTAALEETRV